LKVKSSRSKTARGRVGRSGVPTQSDGGGAGAGESVGRVPRVGPRGVGGGREGRSVGHPVSRLSGRGGAVGRKFQANFDSPHSPRTTSGKGRRPRASPRAGGANGPCKHQNELFGLLVAARPGDWVRRTEPQSPVSRNRIRSLLSDDDPAPSRGELGRHSSSWVGRSGGPSRDGRQRRQPGGSVGRVVPTRNLRRRAARGGRSVGVYRVGNATYGYS